MLRLVHPPSVGKDTRPSKGRRSPALSLTAEEAQHFRAALRNAARAYGSWACLAAAIGVPAESLHQASGKGNRPSGLLIIRAAKAAGMSVEAMLTGTLNAAGRCQACGSRVGDRPQLAAGGAR